MVISIAKIRRLMTLLVFNLVVVMALFILIEGPAGVVSFFKAVTTTRAVAERAHTRYDEQLGWVNLPNVYIPDMYGPGVYFRTNARAFRNNEDFSETVPAGKVRVICSGDSFTLGYGVDNDHTWCQFLASMDDGLQTVNMGQGGYGVDQAYLWYKRDGTRLDHDIHLFAFITTDFDRMREKSFLGYGKPRLKVRTDDLVVDNVPVPRRAFYVPWLTQNQEAFNRLRSVRWLNSVFFQNRPETIQADEPTPDEDEGVEAVAQKILDDLQRINAAKGSRLVLVYLPMRQDYDGSQKETDIWRRNIGVAAGRAGVPFIDLVEAFRQVPPEQVQKLFIAEGALDYPAAAGHYTAEGNEFVARILHERLRSLPEVSTQLGGGN